MQPFWSVIVPVYDRRTYLKQCLDSVLQQDARPEELEILVIDDASPSDLKAFVESIGRGRVNYLRNKTNLGLYPSTNNAIRQVRGRWVHVLHDDDWVLPGFYAALRKGIEAAPPSVGVAFCMYANWHEPSGKIWSPPPFRGSPGLMGRNFLVRLSIANPLNLPAVVYRKDEFEKVGLFREDLPFTADWEWYVRSALQVDWHHQPESLARYRVHALNQTLDLARAGRTARDIRRTVEIFSTMLPSDIAAQALPIARQLHAQRFLTTAMETLQAGNQELSGRYLYEALLLVADAASQPEFSNLLGRPTFSDLREELKASLPDRVSRLL